MAGEETEFNLDPEADQDRSEFSYCGKDADIDAKNERKMFVEEVMELVELKPLKNSILGLPRVNGHLPEQRKRLTISVELVVISLIFMDKPTSGMQGLPPLLFLGHHIFKSVDEATEGVPGGHYPATWKLDVTTFSRKSKLSFGFAQTFDNLRCREQDQ
uniref:Uncharacterized protein n=1 Tax=Brassica oleracea var. oleracea TaxID=109376 RepID=A0A0D3C177_BRAOL